jgi:hypothetical protein
MDHAGDTARLSLAADEAVTEAWEKAFGVRPGPFQSAAGRRRRRAGSDAGGCRCGSCRRHPAGAAERSLLAAGLWPLAEAGNELPVAAVWSAESVLIKQYRLRRYDGAVTLFATEAGHAGEVDPRKIWPRKIGRFDLVWVPGDHKLTEPGVVDTDKAIFKKLAQARGLGASPWEALNPQGP